MRALLFFVYFLPGILFANPLGSMPDSPEVEERFKNAGRGVTLPDEVKLPEELDFSKFENPKKARRKVQSEKKDLLKKVRTLMNERLVLFQAGEVRARKANLFKARLDNLNLSLNNLVAHALKEGQDVEEIQSKMNSSLKEWLEKFEKNSLPEPGISLKMRTSDKPTGEPGFDDLEQNAGVVATDSFGNQWIVDVSRGKHTDQVESSTIKRSHQEMKFEYRSAKGMRFIVFDKKSQFNLKHIIRSKSDVHANLSVDAHLASDLVDEIQSALDSYPGGSGVSLDHANLNVDAHGEGQLNGTVHTETEVDLAIKERERGVHVVLPVAETSTGGKLVFETGLKQRVDTVVFQVVRSKAWGSFNASGSADVDATVDVGGTIDPAGLPGGIPFGYIPPSMRNFNHSETRHQHYADSVSGSGSVDIKKELDDRGVPTSFKSERKYLLIPIGIGFYSSNGSRIRLLVDLKPDRINKPLVINGPKGLKEANEILGMIGKAELDTEGRLDFDAFTLLAGFNASFKTVEIGLKDATGDDQAVAAPLHAKAQLYFGMETDSLTIRQINTIEYNINKAKASAHIETVKRFESGWSFGFLTGYEKHVEAYGMPEYKRSDSFSGSKPFSVTRPQGTLNGTANYSAGHDTIVNEGQSAYREYNVIPVKAMVGVPIDRSNSIITSGEVKLRDENDGDFKLYQAGGGVGWQHRGDNGSFEVTANAYQTYSNMDKGATYPSFALGIGGTF